MDNGLGIPPEAQDRLFTRFFRAHPDHAEGTGLGLSLTREAIRQIGGDVGVESEVGRGSTFYIIAPARATP